MNEEQLSVSDHEISKEPVSPHVVSPQQVVPRRSFVRFNLRRTRAFVAEYSIMLITLAIALGNLISLIYVFFGLIVASMHGFAGSYAEASLFILWLAVSSLVTLPAAAILWSRTQGELAENADFKGEIPKGGARGFRTFWLVVAGLSVLGLLGAAIYAPSAAATVGGPGVDILLTVTLPSLLGIGALAAGMFMVTRDGRARKVARLMLFSIIAAILGFAAVDYIWARNVPQAPASSYPSYPNYTTPPENDFYSPPYNSIY